MQIDRTNAIEVGLYSYKNFVTLNKRQIDSVWEWRNHPDIRKYMYNSDIISYENHLRFLEALFEREDVAYWLVAKGEQVVGVTNLTSIDLKTSRAELGYYIIPDMLNSGIGLEFAYTNMLFAFSYIGCDSLFGGIDKRNINAIMLDSYLGCQLDSEDVENINNISYIRWILSSVDFFGNKDNLNDIRQFVRYMKAKKQYFNYFKKNA
jgi:pseudaminic acid biosynthesis N-acetyl transferase